jgi:hypothetical protein
MLQVLIFNEFHQALIAYTVSFAVACGLFTLLLEMYPYYSKHLTVYFFSVIN